MHRKSNHVFSQEQVLTAKNRGAVKKIGTGEGLVFVTVLGTNYVYENGTLPGGTSKVCRDLTRCLRWLCVGSNHIFSGAHGLGLPFSLTVDGDPFSLV